MQDQTMSEGFIKGGYKLPKPSARPPLPRTTPVIISNQISKASLKAQSAWPNESGGSAAGSAGASVSSVSRSAKRCSDLLSNDSGAPSEVSNTKRAFEKILSQAPREIRDDLSAVASLSISASESFRRNRELRSIEILSLRSDLKKKTIELEEIKKASEISRARLKTMEEMFAELKDSYDAKGKAASRNQRMINKMSKDNRMLVDTLNVLDLPTDSDEMAPSDIKLRKALLPMMGTDRSNEPLAIGRNDLFTLNIQLKEALLRISREHYRSVKAVKVMGESLNQLKESLKNAEQKNRMLQHDLDEMRNDGTSKLEKDGGDNGERRVRVARSFGDFDDKFQALLERQAVDVVDSMMLLRRFVSHLAASPVTLNTSDVAPHIASRELMNIFEVSMVCLYLRIPENPGFMHKYTARSRNPELVDISNTSCLVKEILKFGNPARLNSLRNMSFNPTVDGVVGIRPSRVLSMPLKDANNATAFGVIHFINKAYNNDVFTEGDELFATVFASQVEALLSFCNIYQRTKARANLLGALLRCSVDLMSLMPNQDTNIVSRPNLLPGEVLNGLEVAMYNIMRTAKCRAFLVSSEFIGMEPGKLVFLEKSNSTGATRCSTALSTKFASMNSAVAGLVARTRKMHQIEDDVELHEHLNTEVDLDPLGQPMITISVNLPGGYNETKYETGVVAVLQMVLGPYSLKLRPTADDHDGINFIQAAQWLVHQLSPVLFQLLSCIAGNPLPIIAPQFESADAVPPLDRPLHPPVPRKNSLQNTGGAMDSGSATAAGHHMHHAGPRAPHSTDENRRSSVNQVPTPVQSTGDHFPAGSTEASRVASHGVVSGSHTPVYLAEPSAVYIDPEEHEALKAKLAELQRAEKMRQSTAGQRNNMFSVKAILESTAEPKKSKKTDEDTKFLKFQLDQVTAQLDTARGSLTAAQEARETAEKDKKQLETKIEELQDDVATLKDNEDLLVERLSDCQTQLQSALLTCKETAELRVALIERDEALLKKAEEIAALNDQIELLERASLKKKSFSKAQKMLGSTEATDTEIGMSAKSGNPSPVFTHSPSKRLGEEGRISIRGPTLGGTRKTSYWGGSTNATHSESESATVATKRSFWGGVGSTKPRESSVEEDHSTSETLRAEVEEREHRLQHLEQLLHQTQDKYTDSLHVNDKLQIQLLHAQETNAAKDKLIKSLKDEINVINEAQQALASSSTPATRTSSVRKTSTRSSDETRKRIDAIMGLVSTDGSLTGRSDDLQSLKASSILDSRRQSSRLATESSESMKSTTGDSSVLSNTPGVMRSTPKKISPAVSPSPRVVSAKESPGKLTLSRTRQSEASESLTGTKEESEGDGSDDGEEGEEGAVQVMTPSAIGENGSWRSFKSSEDPPREGARDPKIISNDEKEVSGPSNGRLAPIASVDDVQSNLEREGDSILLAAEDLTSSTNTPGEECEDAAAAQTEDTAGTLGCQRILSDRMKSSGGGRESNIPGNDDLSNELEGSGKVRSMKSSPAQDENESAMTSEMMKREDGDSVDEAGEAVGTYPDTDSEEEEAAAAGNEENGSPDEDMYASSATGGGFEGLVVGDWVQYFDDDSGSTYWVNQVSGESVWDLPADVEASLVQPVEPIAGNGSTDGMGYSASAGGYTIEL